MVVDKGELFEEKGYCVIKKLDTLFDLPDKIEARKAAITEIRKEISLNYKVSEAYIDSNDIVTNEYQIFYDESRVRISIVNNLSEFVKVIASERSNSKNDDHIYYRGHSNTNYKLEPSIYREKNKNILKSEDKMYRDILSSKPHFFSDCNTTLDKLVKMQHHGIPTRLLDLTENPLIALYFACVGRDSNNGEVLSFNISDNRFKYFDSDTVSVITNITKCFYDFDILKCGVSFNDIEWLRSTNYRSVTEKVNDAVEDFLSNKIHEFNENLTIIELTHYIREDKPYFQNKINPLHLGNYTVVVKPKMAIDRIINQSGAFILFGINMKKEVCSNCNINKEGYKQRVIIIPQECKQNILKELKMFNINKSTVFGDLDSTAEYFVEKYK